MDVFTKDIVQVIAWIVAIGGGLVAAWRAILEFRSSRQQRADELRWRKANSAKDFLDAFYTDPIFRQALYMLDWDGRPFEIAPGTIVSISHSDIMRALDTNNIQYEDLDVFIRTCMDRFFEAIERIEHAVAIQAIEYADVAYAFEFYISRLATHRELVRHFLSSMGFEYTLRHFARCKAWNEVAPKIMDKPTSVAIESHA